MFWKCLSQVTREACRETLKICVPALYEYVREAILEQVGGQVLGGLDHQASQVEGGVHHLRGKVELMGEVHLGELLSSSIAMPARPIVDTSSTASVRPHVQRLGQHRPASSFLPPKVERETALLLHTP